jgi:DNA-damage-inducible protein D
MSDELSRELELSSIPEIRRVWHKGEWFYSVVDVIAFLTGTKNPQSYWGVLKNRMKVEGYNAVLHIEQLRLQAADNRFRLTDTMNRQAVLRLVQSIPSPRVEPLRQWLAEVGEERLEEIEDPEAAIERVRAKYRAKGYDDAWIEERIKNDLIRNELTDEWQHRGATTQTQFAILTNELSQGTFDLSVQAYKKYKLLPSKENLRDHMSPLELVLCSLSEATAIELHRDRDSQSFQELHRDTGDAGRTAGEARKLVEKQLGRPVVTPKNYLPTKQEKRLKERKEKGKKPREQSGPTLFDQTTDE